MQETSGKKKMKLKRKLKRILTNSKKIKKSRVKR